MTVGARLEDIRTVFTGPDTPPCGVPAVMLPPEVGVMNGCQEAGVADWGIGVGCGVRCAGKATPELPGAAVTDGRPVEGDSAGKEGVGLGDAGRAVPIELVGEPM